MPLTEKVQSLQNARVKQWARLHKSGDRRETGLMLIEGLREISMAHSNGIVIETLIMSLQGQQLMHKPVIKAILQNAECIEVTDTVFAKIAYRDHCDGLLAVAQQLHRKVEDLLLSLNPLIIVLEAVEKPGNLGAILRTAEAARADAVIVCDPTTDIYNPNVIRSSLGCVFSVPVAACTSAEAMEWLNKYNIKSFAAALSATTFYYDADMGKPSAIILGSEADGLSDFWLKGSTTPIKIPMPGKVDSLNVSTSAAVILFEALRQRRIKV